MSAAKLQLGALEFSCRYNSDAVVKIFIAITIQSSLQLNSKNYRKTVVYMVTKMVRQFRLIYFTILPTTLSVIIEMIIY